MTTHSRTFRELFPRETPDPVPLEELKRREAEVPRTLECPHCGEGLRKWAVPNNPFIEWNTEYLYICFNDECPYLVRGWDTLAGQGIYGFSYRVMYNPETGSVGPVPVANLSAMKDGIVEEV